MSSQAGGTRISARLVRLLNLVPYFLANPGISAKAAAAELGVSPRELMRDLEQLWVCGLPGYGPGDLIDLSFSESSIEVTYSAGIDRPLRLTPTEATALLVALRALIDQPGMVDPAAARRAIAKIEAAAKDARGQAAAAGVPEEADPLREAAGDEAAERIAATVRQAVMEGKALAITYYSASRDTLTDRVTDPVRVVYSDGHSYLQAWCRSAQDVRLFRFDRIDAATILDEPSRPPREALTETPPGLLGDDENLPVAVLELDPAVSWALDYYPIDVISTAPDGRILGEMRFGSFDWMTRFLLGFGGAVAATAPPELVALVRERAQSAITAYQAAERSLQT
jgi:proteasome accessory factor C